MAQSVQETPQIPAAPPPPMASPMMPKKKRKWLRRLIISLVLVGIVGLLVFRFLQGGGGPVASGGSYLMDKATMQDLTISVSGTGTITPIDSYNVTALVKGEILNAPFEEGDVVNEGDLLFAVDPSDLVSNIQRSELSLRRAQNSYDKLARDLATMEADHASDLADDQKDQVLYAKDAGLIATLHVEAGDTIAAGTPVAELLDQKTMHLKVPFHSAALPSIAVGATATVTVDGAGQTLTGTVTEIGFTDQVSAGGALTRLVTIAVQNPGALTDTSTATATVGTTSSAAAGSFSPAVKKTITAKRGGEIATLHVSEGDWVQANTALYTLKGASSDLNKSYNKQVQSQRDALRDAALSIEDGTLSLENARDQLEDYTITSPITGTVIEKNLKAGDTLDATSSTAASVTYPAVIYDMSTLTFDLKIHELDVNNIQVGQPVAITVAALGDKVYDGTVTKVNINGTTQNGLTTYPVTVTVTDPQELLPGMNVSAEILVEETGNVLCIPVEAVSRGNTVLVLPATALDKNGNPNFSLAESRTVVLGRNNDTYIEILDGLSDGDTVLINNQSSNMMSMMMGG